MWRNLLSDFQVVFSSFCFNFSGVSRKPIFSLTFSWSSILIDFSFSSVGSYFLFINIFCELKLKFIQDNGNILLLLYQDIHLNLIFYFIFLCLFHVYPCFHVKNTQHPIQTGGRENILYKICLYCVYLIPISRNAMILIF